jgi:hypothetical protein
MRTGMEPCERWVYLVTKGSVCSAERAGIARQVGRLVERVNNSRNRHTESEGGNHDSKVDP